MSLLTLALPPSRAAHRTVLARTTLAAMLVAGSITVTLPARISAADAASIFDSTTVHAITVSYDQADYEAMIATFQASGDKDWIESTVTIDGVTYERVGMRLKGNSSLSGLGGRFGGGFGGRAGEPAPAASAAPDQATERQGRGPGIGNGATAETPEKLPWLIRLDREIDGQNHGGINDLVVRSNNSQTSLNEAVALELLEAAGLASQQAAPTSFSVNGGAPVLRLIIEHPDDTWQADHFDGPGALYKAESTGDWSYRGEDPEAYADVFDQEAGKDVTDLAPLTGFLRFLNESDDATFAAELPTRFDVDAFARYLAMMDLVQNFDDIDGPGNNAYLHWDATSGMFTIVPWDMNLAFGGLGGGRGFGGPRSIPFDPAASFDPSQLPDGVRPPDDEDGQGFVRMGPGGRGRENPLVTRFLAVPAFEAAYQEQLAALRTQLFESGTAQAILDTWSSVLTANATDLVDVATVTTEAATLAEAFAAGA